MYYLSPYLLIIITNIVIISYLKAIVIIITCMFFFSIRTTVNLPLPTPVSCAFVSINNKLLKVFVRYSFKKIYTVTLNLRHQKRSFVHFEKGISNV